MAGEDPNYTNWIRCQPCAAAHMGDGCKGQMAPHHRRDGFVGMGQRDHDHTAIPLCARHHEAYHRGWAPFAGMSRDERRQWTATAIAYHRHLYENTPDWA